MTDNREITAAFTGHRTYGNEADVALRRMVGELYARGVRRFLCGMAVGFDLAAAEVVLACRASMFDLRLVAVVPFEGQEQRFIEADRVRFRRVRVAADEVVVLSPLFHRGCYAVRNDYLIDQASVLIAWYDGSPGGTHYTVRRALRLGLWVENLNSAVVIPAMPTLF